jgi:hypothetical protein
MGVIYGSGVTIAANSLKVGDVIRMTCGINQITGSTSNVGPTVNGAVQAGLTVPDSAGAAYIECDLMITGIGPSGIMNVCPRCLIQGAVQNVGLGPLSIDTTIDNAFGWSATVASGSQVLEFISTTIQRL